MRSVPFVISLAITIALIVLLEKPFGSVPPIGRFISPQHGFWQNAEPVNYDYNERLVFPQLKNTTSVYFDERMVPHIFAEQETDAYFVQGYLHAKFRLWQMEFQTHAAAGRLTEILGTGPQDAYLNNDRNMRRLGMVYSAKRSLAEIEKDPVTRGQVNAYTAGVNSYLEQLTTAGLPLEYRLLNYLPEKWTNLKTALFLKYMSFDLAGKSSDIEYTNAKQFFSEEDFNKLYPLIQDSLDPIVPKGTVFPAATVKPQIPSAADSLYFQWKDSAAVKSLNPEKNNGSNNWAVSGSKTQSGRPILCNDPHLGLNLPSLWYEMQIATPDFSVYGVSFPGAPYIIIGFNDSIAWGVTNAARDVRDYYRIQFKDKSRREYWFNNEWKPTATAIETYTIKGGEPFYDTVAYTDFGPVMYDDAYNGNEQANAGSNLAVKWKAHEPSNELRTFYQLNRAHNYDDYLAAIRTFVCPGQNFAFASKSGDIAIWQQGAFPAKWKMQGDFIMPGTDSVFQWQGDIPQAENPHVVNPERGFVSSANQLAADTAYPYYLGGYYDVYRGLIINRYLGGMNGITTTDMQHLQMENYNVFAETALPFLLDNVRENELNAEEKKYLAIVKSWNKRNDADEKGVAVFHTWFEALEDTIWYDEIRSARYTLERPESFTLIDELKKKPGFSFVDNINTPETETIGQLVTAAFKKSIPLLAQREANGTLAWYRFQDTGIRHLLRLQPLSRFHLKAGGGLNVINATKQYHGPSWRMVVQLTDKTEAYGIYPGGQSGNPGSRYYDNFVDEWALGNYFELWFMTRESVNDKRVKYVMQFSSIRPAS